MVVDILYLDDMVSCGDDDGKALVEGFATPPPRVSSSAGVVAHKPMLVDHEDRSPVHLTEACFKF